MSSKVISTILNLKDNMSGGIMRVSKNTQNMSKEMKRASQQSATFANNAKKNFEKVGDKAVKLGAAMATLAAGFVIKVGFEGMKELDEAAAKVKSIAGASLDKKVIKKGLLKTSSDTGISTTELGDTQYNAVSSGVSSKESLEAAVTSAKLAKAGFTDANSSLKVLTSTMNVYGLKGQKAMQSISDKMLITQNLGVTTVAELAESMGSVTPIAQAAGASVDELMAGFIGLTKNGIKTDEATTELKGMFTSIIAPTKESADMAASLGLEFNAAALKSKGFAKFMADVKAKTGGNTEKMAGLFGNVRALTGALVLSGAGFKDFNGGLDALKNSAGATDEAFNIMNDTLGNKLNKLKVRTQNIATSIMDSQSSAMGNLVSKITDKLKALEENGSIQRVVDKIAESVAKIIEVAGKAFKFLKDNKKTIENIALAFVSFYVAIKIMKVLKGVIFAVQIAMALLKGALVLTPFGWVAIGITALIVGFTLLYKNSSKFREGVAKLVVKLKEFGSYIIANVVPPLKEFGNYILTNIVPTLKDMAATIKDTVVGAFKFLYPIISDFVTNILKPFAGFLSGILKPIFGVVFSYILDKIKTTFEKVKDIIEAVVKVFGGILQFITGIFTGDWNKAWTGVSNIFGGIWDGIKAIAFGSLNAIIDKINLVTGLVSKIPGVEIPKIGHIGVEDKGTKMGIKPKAFVPMSENDFGLKIPKHAKGTSYAPGGLSLVGEEGPELINLRKGSTVTTADKTSKILGNKSTPIFIININNPIGEKDFFDKAGEHIIGQIKLEMDNM